MKLATYNVNGVNGRLPVLLRWLKKSEPDVVCLQELKAPQEKFPVAAIEKAGYGCIWHGQKAWNGVAILARGRQPEETRRGLPGDPDDVHSRYIEAKLDGLLMGCLYLPNGNPAPGPKFDYKLAWFKRLAKYAKRCLRSTGLSSLLATTMSSPQSWTLISQNVGSRMHSSSRNHAQHIKNCSPKDGSTPSDISTLTSRSIPFGTTSATHSRVTREFASTIFFSMLVPPSCWSRAASTVMFGAGRKRAITRPLRSSWRRRQR
jgi:hypothetical protein